MRARFRRQGHVLAAGLLVAAVLAVVGWIDYQATRRELVGLLRDQALSLRATVAAAVRASRTAATEAERQLGARLLDNARLARELDRRGALDQDTLDRISRENGLFWITVYDARGQRERASGGPRGLGPGPGGGGGRGGGGAGAGRGPGPGPGLGPGATGGSAELLERLRAGPDGEAISEVHTGRGGAARVAAGVRRAGGGVILLNADATVIAGMERAYSLDALLDDIAGGSDEVAYLVLEADRLRLVHGVGDEEVPGPEPAAASGATEREVTVAGRPVLELAGPVEIAGLDDGRLRVGLRLDGVRRAERQTVVRLAVSLSTALVLTLVAIGFLGLRREYGELRERHEAAEEALRRRDRLTAMGELASTVAHEVRNPLNAIAMAARRLTREFAAPSGGAPDPADADELRDLLAVVEGETRRIDAIVQQFLAFARPPALVRQTVDLGAFVRELADAHRPLATARSVALEADAARAGHASLDPSQLRQAADNLLRNAIEATPPGGRVHVRAWRDGDGHVLEVEDSGAGIPPEQLPRIFDLYFTTKPAGTGVGLAVTHQIVSAHGGTIEVDSRPGRGTRMTVRLPHAEEASD